MNKEKVKISLAERFKFKIKDLKNNELYDVVVMHYDINFSHSTLELQSCKKNKEGKFNRIDISMGAIERMEYEVI